MAQRRMFSPDIVSSDAFLEMPASARDLYFQLGMFADDDGFVNPRKYMRMLGSSEDDLKILLAKRFLLPFSSGVVVVKHWKINNLVRKDWYKPTQYLDEKSMLFIKENGVYTDNPDNGIPIVNGSLTTRQHRLGKVSINNTSVAIAPQKTLEPEDTKAPRTTAKYPHSKEVFSWFPDPQISWKTNRTELSHSEMLFERGEKKVKSAILFCKRNAEDPYLPGWETPTQLERNWLKIIKFAERQDV